MAQKYRLIPAARERIGGNAEDRSLNLGPECLRLRLGARLLLDRSPRAEVAYDPGRRVIWLKPSLNPDHRKVNPTNGALSQNEVSRRMPHGVYRYTEEYNGGYVFQYESAAKDG